MSEVMFQVQTKRMRSGVYCGGLLISKEQLLNREFMLKGYPKNSDSYNLEFAEVGKYFSDIKSMTLEQFEKYFTIEDITRMQYLLEYDSREHFPMTGFSKEILLKYGTDICPAEDKASKKLRKLEPLSIYKAEKGGINWLYLGNVDIEQWVNGKQLEIVSGNCFIGVDYVSIGRTEYGIRRFIEVLAVKKGTTREKFIKQHVLKGVKAVTKKLGTLSDLGLSMSDFEEITLDCTYYGYNNAKVTTKITEHKEK